MGRPRKYPPATAVNDALATWRGRLKADGMRAIHVHMTSALLERFKRYRDKLGCGATYASAIEALLDEHDKRDET